MDFSLKQDRADYYKKLTTLSSRGEFTADAVVPDTQEDIARILCVTGIPRIHTKSAAAGTATVTGEVSATVLYVPESCQGAAALNVTVPFSCEQQYGSMDEALPVSSVRIISIEARMLNPRKVLVRTELCITTDIYVRSELVWYCEPEDAKRNGLRTRCGKTSVTVTSSVSEKSFVISDELMMPAGRPAPERLLASGAEIRITDTQSIGGKLIVKGIVRTSVFYAAAGRPQPEYVVMETQFSQLIEVSEGTEFEITPMLTDVYVELMTTGSGDKTISIEIHAVAQTVCLRMQEITFISDAYCTRGVLTADYEKISAEGEVKYVTLHAAPRGQFELQRRCVCVIGTAAMAGAVAAGEGKVSANLSVNVIYQDEDEELYGETFKMTAEAECQEPASDASVSVGDIIAIPAGMSIEIRAQADFMVRQSQSAEITAAVSMRSEDDVAGARRPSVSVIRADTNDLWQIAKKYGADMDDIVSCNGLSEQPELMGRILLIP